MTRNDVFQLTNIIYLSLDIFSSLDGYGSFRWTKWIYSIFRTTHLTLNRYGCTPLFFRCVRPVFNDDGGFEFIRFSASSCFGSILHIYIWIDPARFNPPTILWELSFVPWMDMARSWIHWIVCICPDHIDVSLMGLNIYLSSRYLGAMEVFRNDMIDKRFKILITSRSYKMRRLLVVFFRGRRNRCIMEKGDYPIPCKAMVQAVPSTDGIAACPPFGILSLLSGAAFEMTAATLACNLFSLPEWLTGRCLVLGFEIPWIHNDTPRGRSRHMAALFCSPTPKWMCPVLIESTMERRGRSIIRVNDRLGAMENRVGGNRQGSVSLERTWLSHLRECSVLCSRLLPWSKDVSPPLSTPIVPFWHSASPVQPPWTPLKSRPSVPIHNHAAVDVGQTPPAVLETLYWSWWYHAVVWVDK